MSVVERALRKLQGTSGGRGPSRGEEAVARTVVEKALELPPEGTGQFHGIAGRAIDFDFEALAAAGLLAPSNERLADEYRAIKQPILRKAQRKRVEGASGATAGNRLVMVTSALPGEGKTFTSVNMSLSLAQERDWSVLLIDTDCRNPSLSRLLGVAEEPGLLDYLNDGASKLESYVLPTNIERLYMLPLGKADPQAAELLASERMKSACAALSDSEFGPFISVFDASPLLLTPEPVIIGSQVGQIVLVVQANQTPRTAIADALGKLDHNKSIGLVLNRASADDRLTSYSYGYSYGSYGRSGTDG